MIQSVEKIPEISADVVIVGAGVAGALMSKELANAGYTVLLLEAGRATNIRPEGYASYVENYQTSLMRLPNSPYPQIPNAPSPEVTEQAQIKNGVPVTGGYQVYKGPMPFLSNNVRVLGGTALHMLGTWMRMLPSDLKMQTNFGVGQDWPVSYKELEPYYERVECEVGVAADVKEQERAWAQYRKGYVYPMQQIPRSYLDRWLEKKIGGMKHQMGPEKIDVLVVGTPAGRNGTPNPAYRYPATHSRAGEPFRPVGNPYDPNEGTRCEGNSACVPICPVMAKYNALRTLYSLDADRKQNLNIVTQTVASKIELNENRTQVTGILCQQYDNEADPSPGNVQTVRAKGRFYVIAAHTIETARLLLASDPSGIGVANSSDQVGRNLMDHPYFQQWALAPKGTRLGVFRGPNLTSEIPMRDGAFRKTFAAFRADIRSQGWDFSAGAPYSNLSELQKNKLIGRSLRETLCDEAQRQIGLGYQIEQLPDPENRVTIEPQYKDQLGNYRPVLSWSIDEYTQRAILESVKLSKAVFHKVGAKDYSATIPGMPGNLKINGQEYTTYGSGHIVGTHRMGTDKSNSVTNTFMQTWDHDNLYLVGCGNMPTLGTSNPSLTAAAFAYRAADHIKGQLKSRQGGK